jgi:hypothetical protein
VVHHLIIVGATGDVSICCCHCMVHLMVFICRCLFLRLKLMMNDVEKIVSHFQENRNGSLLQIKIQDICVTLIRVL